MGNGWSRRQDGSLRLNNGSPRLGESPNGRGGYDDRNGWSRRQDGSLRLNNGSPRRNDDRKSFDRKNTASGEAVNTETAAEMERLIAVKNMSAENLKVWREICSDSTVPIPPCMGDKESKWD